MLIFLTELSERILGIRGILNYISSDREDYGESLRENVIEYCEYTGNTIELHTRYPPTGRIVEFGWSLCKPITGRPKA